jgi:hypothetical protein
VPKTINRNNYFIPGFVTTQGVVIPNGHLINESNPVTHITGKFINCSANCSATKLTCYFGNDITCVNHKGIRNSNTPCGYKT